MRLPVALMALLIAACSSPSVARETASVTPYGTPTTSASPVPGGCGSTTVYRGGIPNWLDAAGGHNNPAFLPYAVTHPALAAGFIFGYPLRAGHPVNPSNKILWVVGTPRNGSQLVIDGHPLGASSPTVHDARPDDSGPGEIYPDGIDVPTAGCWQFDLRWATSHVQVELNYGAAQ